MQTKLQKMVFAALLAALLAVLSPFVIPVGLVPITLATFVVFLTGALLPPLYAVASIGVYLLIGLVGLPVFSGFVGGPGVLFGPTGGFLIGYFCLAGAVSLAVKLSQKWWVWAIGVLLGVGLSLIIEYTFDIKTIISFFSIVIAFGVSAAVGGIFGYAPAKRAAERDPIESLRYE